MCDYTTEEMKIQYRKMRLKQQGMPWDEIQGDPLHKRGDDGRIGHTRASPSGKASAFQADIRGFESRCPLFFIKGDKITNILP